MAEAKRKFRIHAALPALVAAFGLEGARAQIHQSDEIIVWGRQVNLIGDASSASEGLVGYADLSLRPLLRTGELVEVIPGMIATQHSGSGKANQYFLRGFNLDHGTDFAAFVDGAPANHRSHGHGHGYLDLNFIIPETVEYVAYRKGAYAADRGDFAIAGSSAIKTYDRFDTGFAQATVGLNEFIRVVGGASTPAFGGDVLIAGEAQVYDGPWELDEDLQRFSALAKYTRERDDDHFQLVLNGYTAEWTSTDQIPLRAVEDGFLVETENGLEEITLSRLGFIDPDLGGETTRISAAAGFQTSDLNLSVYALYYDFELFSNFTYFLSDPLRGDEFEQFDRRWTFGGAATYSFEHEIGGLGEGAKLETRIGGDWRHDDIFDIGLYQTNARERIDLIRDDNLGITSGAAFIDTTMHWTPRLRMTLGARADYVA
ncbi:MAG: TonB-dependent receptor, partial [Pseudomonadota bacterium]